MVKNNFIIKTTGRRNNMELKNRKEILHPEAEKYIKELEAKIESLKKNNTMLQLEVKKGRDRYRELEDHIAGCLV